MTSFIQKRDFPKWQIAREECNINARSLFLGVSLRAKRKKSAVHIHLSLANQTSDMHKANLPELLLKLADYQGEIKSLEVSERA